MPLAIGMPLVVTPEFGVAFLGEVPFPDAAHLITGFFQQLRIRRFIKNLVCEHAVEIAHVGQLPVVVRIESGEQ